MYLVSKKTQKGKDVSLIAYSTGAAGTSPESSLSGLGLGEHCFSFDRPGSYRTIVIADQYSLEVTSNCSKEGMPAVVQARRQYARALCERVARQLVADAMALGLDDDARPTATAYLTGLESSKNGFVLLSNWAQTKGITVTYHADTATASFTHLGKSVKLPLASGKAVINSVERDLGGKFILARGSTWFVPKAELEEAIDLG